MTARATLRQIEIVRAIKAAKKAGAPRVVLPNGVSIDLTTKPDLSPQSTGAPPAPRKPMVF